MTVSGADRHPGAFAAVMKGPLSRAALERLAALQQEFPGEAR
ncbi:MAG: hypothetical protein NT123_03860 [Proteobacteria bacterium]|nr:hypothetical protein [Pseudomonadota bacterium]